MRQQTIAPCISDAMSTHWEREREFLIRAKVMWVSIINTYIKVYSSSGTEITLTDIALVAESWPTMKLLKLETKWPKSAHQTTEHFISGNPSGFFLFFFSSFPTAIIWYEIYDSSAQSQYQHDKTVWKQELCPCIREHASELRNLMLLCLLFYAHAKLLQVYVLGFFDILM